MERKIGEIFKYNGEWYQCVIGSYCHDCAFGNDNCEEREKITLKETPGLCVSGWRSDGKSVIFKKLEKVGEPFTSVGKLYQHYKVFDIDNVYGNVFWCVHNYKAKTLTIEIKQTKEDMEEKGQCCDNRFEIIAKAKEALLKETNIARDEQEMAVIDNILFRCWQMGWLDKYDDTKHSNSESIGKNLKPFSLEAAKAGKPVCTRDGRKARIICFDVKAKKPIAALITNDDTEEAHFYYDNGRSDQYQEYRYDLMMLPEKKEGWVNVYKNQIHNTPESAEEGHKGTTDYIKTIKVSWEE